MATAWAAGLFEGEGFIILHKLYKSVRIGVTSTDHDVLLKMQAIFGGQVAEKTYAKKPAHYKPEWHWRLGKKEQVEKALLAMLPFFGERRACKALDALDHLDGI